MNVEIAKKTVPYDSFKLVFKVIVGAGFYKLVNKTDKRFEHLLHNVYRIFSFAIALIFNLQNIIYIVQLKLANKSIDIMIECLAICIPQINLLIKIIGLNFNYKKVDAVYDLLNDEIFSANSEMDEIFLKENKDDSLKLCKLVYTGVSIAGVFFVFVPIFNRMQNPDFEMPYYFPFDTHDWNGFLLASAILFFYLWWISYGHISLDCLISIYFAQARSQIKIIKYNLEHLTDVTLDGNQSLRPFQYKDFLDNSININFNHIVKRYAKVLWYVRMVNEIFDLALMYQFCSTSAVLCLVIYKMSTSDVTSPTFLFMVVYFFILLGQIFFYCLYGTLLEYESRTVITSAYLCSWESLSPGFRKQMLIAMTLWTKCITPNVMGLVPLSLNTFITIVRSSYTLYTVLYTVK